MSEDAEDELTHDTCKVLFEQHRGLEESVSQSRHEEQLQEAEHEELEEDVHVPLSSLVLHDVLDLLLGLAQVSLELLIDDVSV